MATLQKLRNKAGILIAAIIGLSIFAFVLQDLLTGGKSLLANSRIQFAEIDGKSVSYQEYADKVDKLAEYYRLRYGLSSLNEQMMQGVREEAWDNIVREYATMSEYKKLGISVPTDEVMDMVQGKNPHPIIRQLFADPQTGILNRSFLLQFIRTMDEDPSGAQKTIWLQLENQIISDKAFSKYNNLIRKGLYTTNLEAEDAFREGDKRVDFSYIRQLFTSIPDTAVTYTDADLRKYYEENLNQYMQEATRDIEYIVYEVIPSAEDDQNTLDWINGLKKEFETTTDITDLVNIESDFPFDSVFHTKSELSESIGDFMFKAKPGDATGPYFENGAYKLARLTEIALRPDSVKARHILIQPDQRTSMERTKVIADSVKNLIVNGSDFATLAMTMSDDQSAQNGGDIGWFTEGQMVMPFNEACFGGKKGDLVVVKTQFGNHIIEVLDQSPRVKKVRVAILGREVKPSSKTYQGIYSSAVEFAGVNTTYDKFNAAIAEQNLTKRYASELTVNQQTIPGLDYPRPLIQWVFEAKLHDIGPQIFELGNKFVIAAVTAIREKGPSPLEQIKNEIELEVRKNKKSEKIAREFIASIDADSSLDNIARKMGLQIQEASNISFSSVSIPSAGIEPKVIGEASVLPEGKLSAPVQGNNGVYLLKVNRITQSAEANTTGTKYRLNMMRQSRVYSEAYQALLDASKIKDNRYKFF
jgi:peptidyl-prolyl cis-trans isomerase D